MTEASPTAQVVQPPEGVVPLPEELLRVIQPPILMFNYTPESDAINNELQLSLLLNDIAT